MTDQQHDRFEELLRDAAATYRRPPAERDMPLDAMWGTIEGDVFGSRRSTHSVWSNQWLRIAAALVIGVGIGRVSFAVSASHSADRTVAQVVTRDSVRAAAGDSTAVPFEAATSRYLGQAAALLIALPAESSVSGTDRRFITRANDLLLTTRLLLDSPPSSDPGLRNLLEDLELVLAQVVRLQNNRDPSRRTELELIHQALEQRDVLPRLRSAVSDHAADD